MSPLQEPDAARRSSVRIALVFASRSNTRESTTSGDIKFGCIVTVLAALVASSVVAQQSTVEEYLEALQQRDARTSGIRLTCISETEQGGNSVSGPIHAVDRWTVAIDFTEKRCRFYWADVSTIGIPNADVLGHVEHIITPTEYIRANVAEDQYVIMSRIRTSPDDWENLCSAFPLVAIFGIIPSDDGVTTVSELLQGMNVTLTPETIEGVDYDAIRGEDDHQELTLVFDPVSRHAIRRLTLHRSGNIPEGRPDVYQFDASIFRQVGGVHVPDKLRVVLQMPPRGETQISLSGRTIDLAARPRVETRIEYTIEDLELNPEFSDADFELQTEIPNGTRVTMTDAMHLKYEWHDGEVVPSVDAQAERMVREARFLGGARSVRYWLVLVSGVALLLVGYVTWRRYRAY